MNKRATRIGILLGVVAALTVAATTDQIWQNVYNSTANALQVSVVGSSGTPVATATARPTDTPAPTATPQTISSGKVPFMAVWQANNPSSGTTFLPASGPGAFDSAENEIAPIAVAGTAKHLACWTAASAQTSTKSTAITLFKNGATVGPVCTFNATSTCNTLLATVFQSTGKCCEDTSTTTSFAAGDGVELRFIAANTPNVGVGVCQWEFDPS